LTSEKRIALVGHTPHGYASEPVAAHHGRKRFVFLLSPANASGVRATLLAAPESQWELAQRLRGLGAPLGELFTFISGLYFRGKLSYATRFAVAPTGAEGVHIITPSAGLLPPHTMVTMEQFREFMAEPVHTENQGYRIPLERDARKLLARLDAQTDVVLLGSIASSKYVEPLSSVLGKRLLFPREFVGRGDMSRGGLLLRCVRAQEPLNYVQVIDAVKSGPRTPKLPPAPKTKES
jgi:hypothetical protein